MAQLVIEFFGWLYGRNLLSGLTTNIRDMVPRLGSTGNRLHSPDPKIPSFLGCFARRWLGV
jgi:hypothetical protein